MVLEPTLIIITILWLLSASISDIKTREVPDWISYSLITIAIFIKLVQSITEKDLTILLYSLIGLSLFFLISLAMYYTKQWGGGDAKLLMGLGIIFPTYPSTLLNIFNPNLNLPFLAIIILNLLITGAILGLIYSIFLAITNKEKIQEDLTKEKLAKIRSASTIAMIILIVSFFTQKPAKLIILFLALITAITPTLLILLKSVERVAMTKRIPIKKLTEGDWIVEDIYKKNKLIYNKDTPSVSKEQIQRLQKEKIKKVMIKIGIPFVPAFLVAVILSLIIGSPLFFI